MKKCIVTVLGKDTVGIIAKYVHTLRKMRLISSIFLRPSFRDISI